MGATIEYNSKQRTWMHRIIRTTVTLKTQQHSIAQFAALIKNVHKLLIYLVSLDTEPFFFGETESGVSCILLACN